MSPARAAILIFLVALGIGETPAADAQAIYATKIYASPNAPPISDGVVLLRGRKIAAVGPRGRVALPEGVQTSDCHGVVTAGFQNSHVHFMYPRFQNAASMSAAQLETRLEEMLTRFGYTSVFDLTSDQSNTFAIRKRIASGEVRGPRIRTAGLPIFPSGGIPFYIKDQPPEFLEHLYQPRSPAEARKDVRANIVAGTDATKLFMATSPERNSTIMLPPDIALAAAKETHARGKPVLAHPTNVAGIEEALDAGVDVIVHTTVDGDGRWDEALIRRMVTQNMALIPTLRLWAYEMRRQGARPEIFDVVLAASFEQLRGFMAAGGQVLFGTDVGYMLEFDPTDEYEYMAKAGMTAAQILGSLTTAPAARWQDQNLGRVETDYQADLVVLAGDPADDVKNFANVRCVFRAGKLIYAFGKSP